MPSTYRHIGEAAPYYDDYVGSKHDDKGYLKVLWKPSRAVQARELTQMQTYTQNQIASLGGYLFKDGTVVHGGIISTTTKQKYFIGVVTYPQGMSLEDAMAGFTANNKIGKANSESIDNQGIYPTGIGDIKFQIVGWTTLYDANGNEATTATLDERGLTTTKVVVFYNIFGGSFAKMSEDGHIVFTSSGKGLTFSNPVRDTNSVITVQNIINESATSISDLYLTCTCASNTKGTIFVDGYFVNCPMSSIMINPIILNSDNTISVGSIATNDVEYNIGYWIERKIVNSYEDETLTDPASGTYNAKAPGADRYSMLAKLRCFSSDEIAEMIASGENILQVHSVGDIENGGGATSGIKFAGGIVMKNNVVIKEQSNIGTNAALMDELAKRTYEESGNYTVNPWKVQIEPKTITMTMEDGKTYEQEVPDKYNISISPGLGYVYGYRVSSAVSQTIENTKPRIDLLREGNSKFTEDSLHVFSDDIYTFNDCGPEDTPTRNVNSWHIEKLLSAGTVHLLDRKIGEMLKKYDEEGNWTVDNPADLTGEDRLSLDNPEVVSLGTASIVDISADSMTSLKISILNASGMANLSNVSSIASFNEDGILTGYIDLLHNGEGNTTIWKNVEAPLIFELDWSWISPNSMTTATYICNAFVKATGPAVATNGVVGSTFNPPKCVGSPATNRSINFLVDETTGEIIPGSKVNVSDPGSDASFGIVEASPGVLKQNNIYWVSYQGDGKVVAAASTSTHSQSTTTFRTKTLEIASRTIGSQELAEMINRFKNTGDDTFVLKKGYVENGSSVSTSSFEFVTDLVKILAIEKIFSTSDNGYISSQSSEEAYWNVPGGLASRLKIFDGCTDSRYESPTITGLASWALETYGDTAIADSIKITFAYWKHESSTEGAGFYYAGSYAVGESAAYNASDTPDTFKQRLAEWYGTNSLGQVADDAYRLIPKYKSESGAWYDLTNCFDFRPDYDGTQDLMRTIPIPASRIQYDVATYLPRIDSVWVDKNGNFGVSRGTPSDIPTTPREKDGTMTIYNIYNKPYGKTIDDIVVEYIDNKRHTMIDITELANRLANLEEVVSLSMAEQSAVNMQIVDSDGLNRYKCGIFTDSFSSFENCGYGEDEWKATIDGVEKCVRADFKVEDWGFSPVGIYYLNGTSHLLEKQQVIGVPDDEVKTMVFGQSDVNVNGQTKKLGGKILTIAPIKNSQYVSQGCPSEYSWVYAKNDTITESTNLQAMMFVIWKGNLTLTPAIDTWTHTLEDVIVETGTYEYTKEPDPYRRWTVYSDGTRTSSEVKATIPSGLHWTDLDKLMGGGSKAKAAGITHLPGWWEPATTLTEVTTYKTKIATQVTEKTTYTGSWATNDVITYMEAQDEFMRVRKVKFELKGMRPNQQFHAAMDNVPLKLLSEDQFNDPNVTEADYSTFIESDNQGNASGYFVVPDNMPVGTKLVEFFDDEETSGATADYTANGKTVWNHIDRSYIQVWTAGEVTQSMGEGKVISEEKVGTQMTSTATAIFHGNDPIAESFYVEEPDGITLESIDIFFATKDPTVGVEVFLVECENGFPGQIVVPFSRVFVSADNVVVNTEESVTNGQCIPTNFKFPAPLQLQGMKEYAFIVIAPSYNYEIYTSTLGKADLRTGVGVREQPYVGSMFKSQNLRTWTEEQLSDISFRMYKYQFQTNIDCIADFAVDDLVAKNTGITSTLPETGESGEGSSEFNANAMTVSIGTYAPTGTDIKLEWHSDATMANASSKEANSFINKEDIFFKEKYGLAISNKMEKPKGSEYINDTSRFTNINSTMKVRVHLKTSNPNIAPQVDLEDFHGLFSRNLVDLGEPCETINGLDYYDAGTYLSNTISLKDPALGLKLAIDAMLPNNSLIKAYFKTTGAMKTYYSVWTPSLGESDYVFHKNVEGDDSALDESQKIQRRLLPGYQESSWKEIVNDRAYIWYYIYDAGDRRKKFILPNQEAHYGYSLSGYSHSSCMFKSVSTAGELQLMDSVNTNIDTKASKIVLKDPVNLDIIPNPITYKVDSDATATGGNRRLTLEYASGDANSNCIVLGAVAIPVSDDSPLDPNYFFESEGNGNPFVDGPNANYKGIFCAEYNERVVYAQNDICLYNGSIWSCVVSGGISGLSPSSDASVWKRVPCALLVSGMINETSSQSQWIELDVNEYSHSTERENNFMEYTYTLASSLELNEFDSFILKLRMLALDTRNIPRFRNLRAVAVY